MTEPKQEVSATQAEQMQRMNRPIDASVPFYKIATPALVELFRQIDELPMKHARNILPLIQLNIDPLNQ